MAQSKITLLVEINASDSFKAIPKAGKFGMAAPVDVLGEVRYVNGTRVIYDQDSQRLKLMQRLKEMEDYLYEHSKSRLKQDTIAVERPRPTNEMKIKVDNNDLKLFNLKSYDEITVLYADGSKCDNNLDLGVGSVFEVTVYWKSYAKENCPEYGVKLMTDLDRPIVIHHAVRRITGIIGNMEEIDYDEM